MHQRLEALKLAEELGNVSRVCREEGYPNCRRKLAGNENIWLHPSRIRKDEPKRAIPVEIGNIIPHLSNRKVSKENIFFAISSVRITIIWRCHDLYFDTAAFHEVRVV